MPNERTKLILDPGSFGQHHSSRGRGESRGASTSKGGRAKFYGPFTNAEHAVDVSTRYARRSGRESARGTSDWGRSRWMSAACCAAPLALLALASGARAYVNAKSGGMSGVNGFRMRRNASVVGDDSVGLSSREPGRSGRREWWRFKKRRSDDDVEEDDDEDGGDEVLSSAPHHRNTPSPKVSSWGTWKGEDTVEHPHVAFDAGKTTGVALHGWLQLEEWYFSQGSSHAVDAGRRDENGICFPPMFPDAKSLGFSWASEGDLVNKLVKHYGAKAAVSAFAAHRAKYITDEDLMEISSQGIELVRLPLTWSVFARDPSTVPRGGERILVDPVYPDRLFVNMAGADLDAVIERIRNAGLKVLIDLHNMPGGAASGTYNGVFPHPPMMFAREDLQRTGLAVVRNMLDWYKKLPEESRMAVHGITLLNEPGHKLPHQRTKVLGWLAKAVQMYKDEVVNTGVASAERVPFLYVNMIETLDLNVADMAAWMRSQFTVRELEEWAVLDVHHYFAWSYTGCIGGSNSGCSFSCDDRPSVVAQNIGEHAGDWAGTLRAAAETYGVKNLAVSEWSLATFSDSSRSCSNREVLDIMFEHQEQAYRGAGIQGFFWGWKMPHGGSHVKAWSLSDYLAESADDKFEHALIPHGYELEDTLQLPEGATKEDEERLIRAYSQFPSETKPKKDEDGPGMLKIHTSDVLKLLSAAAGRAQNPSFDSPEVGRREYDVDMATEEFRLASSRLRKMVDVDAYDDDEETEETAGHALLDDDDVDERLKRRAVSTRHADSDEVGEKTKKTSSHKPTASTGSEEGSDEGVGALIDPAKAVPPPPPSAPSPPPPSPPRPPRPPSRASIRASEEASDILSDMELSSSDVDVPDKY